WDSNPRPLPLQDLYALAVGYGQRSLSDISCFGTASSLMLRVSVFKEARTSRTSGSTLALLPLSYGPVKSARQDSNLQPLHSSGLFVRSCRWVRACSLVRNGWSLRNPQRRTWLR